MKVTKAMCGADCWTYRRLIVYNMKLHLQQISRTKSTKEAKHLFPKECTKEAGVASKLAHCPFGSQANQSNIEEQ